MSRNPDSSVGDCGDAGTPGMPPAGVTGALASRLRAIATTVTLPRHDQLLGLLLLLLPLVLVFRIGGVAQGLTACAGLAAYIGCLQLAYGGAGTLQNALRANSRPGWPDIALVPLGIGGLGVYAVTAARCLSSLLG